MNLSTTLNYRLSIEVFDMLHQLSSCTEELQSLCQDEGLCLFDAGASAAADLSILLAVEGNLLLATAASPTAESPAFRFVAAAVAPESATFPSDCLSPVTAFFESVLSCLGTAGLCDRIVVISFCRPPLKVPSERNHGGTNFHEYGAGAR